MSRFHDTPESLAADGAMAFYRRMKGDHLGVYDPAEWIEALHREHWAVCEQLRTTEGERFARLGADVMLAVSRLTAVQAELSQVADTLGLVLGETPVVARIEDANTQMRSILRALEEAARG